MNNKMKFWTVLAIIWTIIGTLGMCTPEHTIGFTNGLICLVLAQLAMKDTPHDH